jgi:hypothetical protein
VPVSPSSRIVESDSASRGSTAKILAGAERAAPAGVRRQRRAVLAAEHVEPEPAAADRDHRARREVRALDRDAVDRGAVGAAEIADQVTARRRRDRDVVARHRGIGEDHRVGRRGADRELGGAAVDRELAVGALDHGEPVAREPELGRAGHRGGRSHARIGALGHPEVLPRLTRRCDAPRLSPRRKSVHAVIAR